MQALAMLHLAVGRHDLRLEQSCRSGAEALREAAEPAARDQARHTHAGAPAALHVAARVASSRHRRHRSTSPRRPGSPPAAVRAVLHSRPPRTPRAKRDRAFMRRVHTSKESG
jgi:hypothetical protein